MGRIRLYRDEVVQSIKDAGQELIDRAEDMISANTDMVTGFRIEIDIQPRDEIVRFPGIRFETSVLSKRVLERWRNGRNE